MTSGDMTRDEAASKQTFTGREDCGAIARGYDGKIVPQCDPMCSKCLSKWMDEADS